MLNVVNDPGDPIFLFFLRGDFCGVVFVCGSSLSLFFLFLDEFVDFCLGMTHSIVVIQDIQITDYKGLQRITKFYEN